MKPFFLICLSLTSPVASSIALANQQSAALAEAKGTDAIHQPATAPRNTSPPASKVDVAPVARDDEIQARLANILNVAGLFEDPHVRVKDGVVFLSGRTVSEANKQWASDLARNTEDVVAVVNHIEVTKASLWDFEPVLDSVRQMEVNFFRSLPLAACGVFTLVLSYGGAILATRWMRRALPLRVYAPLLREVFARCAGALVMLVGLYVTLRIANLTHLAMTIAGGTGLVGLILGIAFGNITENFLASILLSMQQPFRVGDLVQAEGTMGYVQRLTTRTTIITTVDGNEVQIPNATIYKTVIRNFSTIPNCRVEFSFTVPRDKVDAAQQQALDGLVEHPAILREPEPMVLVEGIADSTIALRAYFWINGRENDMLKVRSSAMRLVLRAIDCAATSRPSARGDQPRTRTARKRSAGRSHSEQVGSATAGAVAAQAEGQLTTEAPKIEEQGEKGRHDFGENLLRSAGNGKAVSDKREPSGR